MTEPHPPADIDLWDPDRLRLPQALAGDFRPERRPPRHRPGETFLRGPIPFAWVAAACRLPGSGLQVAMAVRFLCGRYPRRRGWSLAEIALRPGLPERTARRGLHVAESAGLVTVAREPGCKLALSIREPSRPTAGPPRRPLYGPIPWAWWYVASRLPGKALQVATVCWLVAGWERSAVFELAWGEWAELGLSRFSAGRGLRCLDGAGLVAVDWAPGLSPTVTILDGPPP